MTRLTDSQLVVLSAAAARSDHAVLPPPASMTLNKAALTKVINSLSARGLIAEGPATPTDTIWREDGDQRLALAITAAGLDAIGIESGDADPESLQTAPRDHRPSERTTGKPEAVLALLRRPEGAGIADMNSITGWQPHSIRAFVSGLRKKGLEVSRSRNDGGKAVYRIVGGDVQ